MASTQNTLSNDTTKQTGKYIDLLDEDKPISGQKFVCISFVSPEHIIKQKEMYYFDQFLKQFEFNKTMEKFTQFLNFISFKYKLKNDLVNQDFEDFVKEERDKMFFTTLEDDYRTYIEKNEERLHADFNEQYNFQTNTRGVKVRGCFNTQEEAELRCKLIREFDPNHDVFVGPVGMWMPFHPDAYKTGRVEYLEDELNKLMHEKVKNEKTAKSEFDKRVRETKERAIKENMEKAERTGNKLTQGINEKGELISVNSDTSLVNTIEQNIMNSAAENGVITSADIKRELFEGDNIITDPKNDDHGLTEILEREKNRQPTQTVEQTNSNHMEEVD